MNLLLKIIYRPCCEQFYVVVVVPLSKKVVPLCRRTADLRRNASIMLHLTTQENNNATSYNIIGPPKPSLHSSPPHLNLTLVQVMQSHRGAWCKARLKLLLSRKRAQEVTIPSCHNGASDHSGHYSFTNHAVSRWALRVQPTISALILCALSQQPPTVPQERSPLNFS